VRGPRCDHTQAQEQHWALEVTRRRQAAAGALSNVALSRRLLLRWHDAAWQRREWRVEEARLARLGEVCLARWALRRLREAAAQQRALSVLMLRRRLGLQRGVLYAWRRRVAERRCVRGFCY
jgi:hypothetical protein